MKALLPWTLVALFGGAALTAGCPERGGQSDGGEDGDVPFDGLLIEVSGNARIHPFARAWLEDAGMTVPGVDALTLEVQEPFKAALGDSNAVFATVTLDAGGAFRVLEFPVSLVNVGVAAAISDETGQDRVTSTSTLLYDVAAINETPSEDLLLARPFALPTAFHAQLTQAITPAAIQSHTSGAHTTLYGAGFVLGQVVNASGLPVANAKLLPDQDGLTAQLYYPTATVSSTQSSGTSSNGLFVFVHSGAEPLMFHLTVEGQADYLPRTVVAASGGGQLMTVYPGLHPPP